MAFFDSFTESLKQKWLQFFQVNRDWISLHMSVESVYTPDGGKRPPSYLILGVVNALEPKLAQLMYPFAKLNPDADTLIEVLDLNFDPDIALGNRVGLTTEPVAYASPSPTVEEETLDSDESTGFASDDSTGFEEETVQEFTVSEESLTEEESFGDISLENGHNPEVSESEADVEAGIEFGDISFDTDTVAEEKDETGFGDLNPPEESAFSDVLSDVWGDETALQKGEESNDGLGEELTSGVFDESEIARLFPNS
jgi:hypothetical protein